MQSVLRIGYKLVLIIFFVFTIAVGSIFVRDYYNKDSEQIVSLTDYENSGGKIVITNEEPDSASQSPSEINKQTDQKIEYEPVEIEKVTASINLDEYLKKEDILLKGKIPAINSDYYISLDGSNLFNLDAGHLGGLAESSFLKSDRDDWFEAQLTVTGSPKGPLASDAPLYINPNSSGNNDAMFGIALAGDELFKVTSLGDTWIDRDLHIGGVMNSSSGYITGNLTVDGTITGNITGTISPGLTQGSVAFIDSSGNFTEDNTNFYWDDTNNRLGIGTNSPAHSLDVNGSIRSQNGVMYLGNTYLWNESGNILRLAANAVTSGGDGWIVGRFNAANNKIFFGDTGTQTLIQSGHSLGIRAGVGGAGNTALDPHLFIKTGTGEVGIGTSSPTGAGFVSTGLHIADTDGTNEYPFLKLQNSNTDWTIFSGLNSSSLAFRNGTSDDRMVITSGGNIGIGTDSPSAKLDVLSLTAQQPAAIFKTSDDDETNNLVEFQNSSGTRGSFYFDSGVPTFRIGGVQELSKLVLSRSGSATPIEFVTGGTTLALNNATVFNIAGQLKANEYITSNQIPWVKENEATDGGTRYAITSFGYDINNKSHAGVPGYYTTFYGGLDNDHGNIAIKADSSQTADLITFLDSSNNKLGVFDSNGNLGIGTSSPISKLHIDGAVTGKALVTLNETGDQDIFTASASGSTKFVIDNSGNVGIGTNSPGSIFEIESSDSLTRLIVDNTAVSGNSLINFRLPGVNEWSVGIDDANGDQFVISDDSTLSTARLIIDQDGLVVFNETGASTADFRVEGDTDANLLFVDASADAVGIGTNSVTSGYTLETFGKAVFREQSSNYGAVEINPSTQNAFLNLKRDGIANYAALQFSYGAFGSETTLWDIGYRGGPTNDGIHFRNSSGQYKLSLEQEGYLGLGTGSSKPANYFEVNGTDTRLNALVSLNETGSNDIFTASSSGTTRFVVDNSGNVGIGTANPGARLSVMGSSGESNVVVASGATAGSVTQRGIFLNPQPNSEATLWAQGIYARVDVPANYNQTNNTAYYVANPSTPLSGTITNLHGLYVESLTKGTNNYAIVTNAGNIVFNEGGDADTDFRVEGDTEANLLFVDASTDMVGIGTNSPGAKLDIQSSVGGEQLEVRNPSGNVSYIAITDNSTGSGISNGLTLGYNSGAIISNRENTPLSLSTNDTVRFRISRDGLISVGDLNPEHLFDFEGYYAGNALVSLNETGSNDIFTASASGTTKFTIQNSGLTDASVDGIATLVNAGAITDGSYAGNPMDGLMGVDSSNGRLYFRYGGGWHYVAQTAGFQIPDYETFSYDFSSQNFDQNKPLAKGDFLLPFVDEYMQDGAVHGLYTKFNDVKFDIFSDVYLELDNLNNIYSQIAYAEPDVEVDTSDLASLAYVDGQISEIYKQVEKDYISRQELEEHIGLADRILSFFSDVVFRAKATFESSAYFIADATFRGPINVNADTAGEILIPANTRKFRIDFDNQYDQIPVVYINVSNNSDVEVEVTKVTKEYFEAEIDPSQSTELKIKWLVLVADKKDPDKLRIIERSEDSKIDQDLLIEEFEESTGSGEVLEASDSGVLE